MGYFIVDTTYTLFERIYNRKKIFEAHRSHAYQKATLKFKSHSIVVLMIMLINIFGFFQYQYW